MRMPWTAAERRELVFLYPSVGATVVAERIGRSLDAVCSQARKYRIKSSARRFRQGQTRSQWSETINARFFQDRSPHVYFALGFIWATGSVRTKHRKVLRLVCHVERIARLQKIHALLGSKHQIQQIGARAVVEIGNSFLVQSLMNQFGKPPGKALDNSLPHMEKEMLPFFAHGHIFATGISVPGRICWRGHPGVISGIVQEIQKNSAVLAPEFFKARGKVGASWTEPGDIEEIRGWLSQSELRLTRW